MADYYRILEIEPSASQEKIRSQYLFLMKVWHPDRFKSPEDKERAEEKSKQINEAYNALKNSAKGNAEAGGQQKAQSEAQKREKEAKARAEAERRQKEQSESHKREQEARARAEAERRQREQTEAQRREHKTQAEAENRQSEHVKTQSDYQTSHTNDQSKNEIRKIYLYPGIVILVVIAGYFFLRNQFPSSQLPTSTPSVVIASVLPFAPTCPESLTISTPNTQGVAVDKAIPTPEIQETNIVCVTKIPYTALRITEGSEFVSLDPAFQCIEELTRDGYTIISCTGKPSSSFDLRVCLPSSDLGKCSQDMAFDSKNQCCVPSRPQDVGCTTFKVDIRSCP